VVVAFGVFLVLFLLTKESGPIDYDRYPREAARGFHTLWLGPATSAKVVVVQNNNNNKQARTGNSSSGSSSNGNNNNNNNNNNKGGAIVWDANQGGGGGEGGGGNNKGTDFSIASMGVGPWWIRCSSPEERHAWVETIRLIIQGPPRL
jgi:hypothetical protein